MCRAPRLLILQRIRSPATGVAPRSAHALKFRARQTDTLRRTMRQASSFSQLEHGVCFDCAGLCAPMIHVAVRGGSSWSRKTEPHSNWPGRPIGSLIRYSHTVSKACKYRMARPAQCRRAPSFWKRKACTWSVPNNLLTAAHSQTVRYSVPESTQHYIERRERERESATP